MQADGPVARGDLRGGYGAGGQRGDVRGVCRPRHLDPADRLSQDVGQDVAELRPVVVGDHDVGRLGAHGWVGSVV